MDNLIVSFLCCGAAVATFSDFKTGKIPNLITFPLMLAGLAYHTAMTGMQGLVFSSVGLLLGIGILFILYVMGGMGAGDAKLLGAVGSLIGPKGVVIALVFSMLSGLVYAVVLLMIHRGYIRSFFPGLWLSSKTFLLTGEWVSVSVSVDEKPPALRYALPIAIGTIGYVLLKITGSNMIQKALGFEFTL